MSSRLRPAEGRRRVWRSPSGHAVALPVILDIIHIDPDSGRLDWSVEATVDLVAGEPHLTRVVVEGTRGLSVVHLQRYFRWATPLDVVRRTVPVLMAKGVDPFSWHYPVVGFPDALRVSSRPRNQHSDAFLEEIARQYLALGPGYARIIGFERAVSERTVVSWVEKARKRGILTGVRQGQFGGVLVPSSRRRGHQGHGPTSAT